MEYLTDKIADEEIDQFEQKEYVIINSPTGSGKTTFVLKSLLPRAITEEKHIVFICNRTILRDQIEVSAQVSQKLIFGSLTTLSEQESDYIHIFTYQYCEVQGNLKEIRIPDTGIVLTPANVKYYIFDEAHYFLNDSLFNQGTHYWAEGRRFGEIGIKIFMTATPEPLVWFLSAVIPWNRERLIRLRADNYNSEIKIPNLYKMICDNAEERGKLKRKLQKGQIARKTIISFNKDSNRFENLGEKKHINYSDQDILNECRKIEIFSEALEAMQEQIKKAKSYYTIFPSEAFKNNYDQFIEYYYELEDDLIDSIKETPKTEKWLIFVSDSDNGFTLKGTLCALGINAVFLSRRTITKETKVQVQYNQIVAEGKFSCQVLIATSVMDCGVSITDTSVKHIAISQSDKVTFLQMLGRRRLVDGEFVCLYIKAFTAKQIYGIKRKYEGKVILMSQYGLINDPKVKHFNPTKYDDGIRYRDHFGEEKVNEICNELNKPDNNSLTYIVRGESKIDSSTEVTEIRANNITAFIALLYVISELTVAIEEYESNGDTLFYLKQQLSWIGKTYDERHWLTLRSNMDRLNDLFEKSLDEALNKEKQQKFSLNFLEIAMSLPTPPPIFKVNSSRYKEKPGEPQKSPGRNRVNKAIKELRLPFYVDAKSIKKKTVWVVTRQENSD